MTSTPYRRRRTTAIRSWGCCLTYAVCAERNSLRHSSLPPPSANYTPAVNSPAAEMSAHITHAARRPAMFPINPPIPLPATSLPTQLRTRESEVSLCFLWRVSLPPCQPTLHPLQFFFGSPSYTGLIAAEPSRHTWGHLKY